jgi:hypothetical protein
MRIRLDPTRNDACLHVWKPGYTISPASIGLLGPGIKLVHRQHPGKACGIPTYPRFLEIDYSNEAILLTCASHRGKVLPLMYI